MTDHHDEVYKVAKIHADRRGVTIAHPPDGTFPSAQRSKKTVEDAAEAGETAHVLTEPDSIVAETMGNGEVELARLNGGEYPFETEDFILKKEIKTPPGNV